MKLGLSRYMEGVNSTDVFTQKQKEEAASDRPFLGKFMQLRPEEIPPEPVAEPDDTVLLVEEEEYENTGQEQEVEESFNNDYYRDTYLGPLEGKSSHKSLEGGKDTAAYGVKYQPKGLKKLDDPAENASAVAGWHKDSAARKFNKKTGKEFADLPLSQQYALADLHYNAGSIFNSAPKAWAKGDAKGGARQYLTITASTITKNGVRKKRSVLGLAKRRAVMVNGVLRENGDKPLSTVELKKKGNGSQFIYKDETGAVVFTVNSSYPPLSEGSIEIPNIGSDVGAIQVAEKEGLDFQLEEKA